MIGAPCKNCQDRELGCHGKCEKYISFCNENEKIKQMRFKEQEDLYAITDYRNHTWRRVGKRFRK